MKLLPAWFPITILHFPHRSYGQFERKVRNGGAAMAANIGAPERTCRHWRHQYDILQQGNLMEYWRNEISLPESEVTAGLADGSLVADTRLRDRLDHLRPSANGSADTAFELPPPK